jgi:hypothetical protein
MKVHVVADARTRGQERMPQSGGVKLRDAVQHFRENILGTVMRIRGERV